jgi:hypothetical protein
MAVQWLKSIVHGHSPLSPTHPAPKHSYRWTNTTYADTKRETMMPPSLDYSVAVTLAYPSWSSRRLSLASYSSGLYRLLGKSRGRSATKECAGWSLPVLGGGAWWPTYGQVGVHSAEVRSLHAAVFSRARWAYRSLAPICCATGAFPWVQWLR